MVADERGLIPTIYSPKPYKGNPTRSIMVKSIREQVGDEEWKVIDMFWDKAYEQYCITLENERTEERIWGYVS